MISTPNSGSSPDTLNVRLAGIHNEVKAWLPNINRISVALYDADTDVLKTFINSTDDGNPLEHYEATLSSVPSLEAMAADTVPRTLNDMTVLAAGDSEHTNRILQKGYLSSHTVPIVHNGQFHGFVFFNASQRHYFTDTVVYKLGVYTQLVGLLFSSAFLSIQTLHAEVHTARILRPSHDAESALHPNWNPNFSTHLGTASDYTP